MDDSFKIIVKTLAGLEEVLVDEMKELQIANIEPARRAVFCTGNIETIYKLNMYCRTALKVLKPIYEFKADTADKVYHAVRAIEWEDYLDVNQSLAIDSVIFSEKFSHSKFVAYRVKDAIADYFTKKYDKRPSVSLTNPDLRINIHIADDNCTLSLDSSGESLHKRGWREASTEAPINEVLAAGILLISGWKGQSDFYDPMCGSGTFLVEAAMIAKGIAPGLYRDHFAFEKWKDFDQELFNTLYEDESMEKDFEFKIYGSDVSAPALSIAEKNIKSAGLSKCIELNNIPFQRLEPNENKGYMVLNPPYGERLKMDDLTTLYETIGERLKHNFQGYNTWIISHKQECFHAVGLRPSQKINLFNGALECQLRQYETYDGKMKEEKKSRAEQEEEAQRMERYGIKDSEETKNEGDSDRASGSFKNNDGKRSPMKQRDGDRKNSFSSRDRDDNRGDRKFESKPPRKSDAPKRSFTTGTAPSRFSKPSQTGKVKRPGKAEEDNTTRNDGKPKRPRI